MASIWDKTLLIIRLLNEIVSASVVYVQNIWMNTTLNY
jgi:hypothetical protein